ncbi:phage tail protein [Deltaproteobacteria bacterium Smac51]|nr:phage tail protein [Deltaproteobacteria bacterium Smac51]
MTISLPSANIIPDKLINAKIYMEGKDELMGVGDAELPDVEFTTESIAGLGLAGELETPVMGHVKSLPFKFKFNVISTAAMVLLQTKTHHLEVYASIQRYDTASGELGSQPVKVVLKTLPKKVGMGKIEAAKKMDNEVELECVYFKLWIGGEEVLEIDKLNFIYRVLGEDMLATVRRDLGME